MQQRYPDLERNTGENGETCWKDVPGNITLKSSQWSITGKKKPQQTYEYKAYGGYFNAHFLISDGRLKA